jgi:hypothetical protein
MIICWSYEALKRLRAALIGLHHPLDGVTNPEYKLSHFIQVSNFLEKNALAFNR